jgi:hypothetical protein
MGNFGSFLSSSSDLLEPYDPPRPPVLQPGLGISRPFWCTMPTLLSLGTEADRPKRFGLLNSWVARQTWRNGHGMFPPVSIEVWTLTILPQVAQVSLSLLQKWPKSRFRDGSPSRSSAGLEGHTRHSRAPAHDLTLFPRREGGTTPLPALGRVGERLLPLVRLQCLRAGCLDGGRAGRLPVAVGHQPG